METILSIIDTIDTVLTVGFWLSLAVIGLVLLRALRSVFSRPGRPRSRTPAAASQGGFGGAPVSSGGAFNPRSPAAIRATRKWADSDHPDAAFKWARAAGWPMGPRTRGLDPLSCGGGRAYDGENGPLGFTTRDAELLDAYFAAANSIGADCGGWVVVATNGEEWDRYNGGGRWRRPQQGEAGP